MLYGGVALAGTNWSFTDSNPVSFWATINGGIAISSGLGGEGTVIPRARFEGTYGMTAPGTVPIALDFDVANALAVTQADVARTWLTSNFTFSVDSSGVVTARITGSIGDCTLSGTVMQTSPGTNKNLFSVAVTPSDGPSGECTMRPGEHTGRAAITFLNVGSVASPSYVRSLTLLFHRDSRFIAAQLPGA